MKLLNLELLQLLSCCELCLQKLLVMCLWNKLWLRWLELVVSWWWRRGSLRGGRGRWRMCQQCWSWWRGLGEGGKGYCWRQLLKIWSLLGCCWWWWWRGGLGGGGWWL